MYEQFGRRFSVVIVTGVCATLEAMQCTSSVVTGINGDRLDEETRDERSAE